MSLRRGWTAAAWASIGLAAASASAADTPLVFTNGTVKPQVTTGTVGSLLASGTTGVYAKAGSNVNADVTNGGDKVFINYSEKGIKLSVTGTGTVDRFKYADGKGQTYTTTGKSTQDNKAGTATTTTTALSTYSAADPIKVKGGFEYNTTLTAKGNVDDKADLGGLAASTARDPYSFHFDTAGTLAFHVVLGDASASGQSSSLSFASNSTAAFNSFDYAANITGVTYNGQSFNGEIFDLSITSSGVVSSNADLKVVFTPSPLLNLSPDNIAAVDTYVAGQLTPQSDGSVGLAPGTELNLTGTGSPLADITFGYGDNSDVVYSDTLSVHARAVPEPASLAMIALGGMTLLASARKRRLRPAPSRPRGVDPAIRGISRTTSG